MGGGGVEGCMGGWRRGGSFTEADIASNDRNHIETTRHSCDANDPRNSNH